MAVNFKKSYIKWIVNKGGSCGRYALEALLRINKGRYVECWALGSPVLAGNMYYQDKIIKKPFYQFQIAATSDKNVIYRNKIFGGSDYGTSAALNKELFRELKIDLDEDSGRIIREYNELEIAYDQNKTLVGVVHVAEMCELEFPIKVINIDPQSKKFHIETGPVLFDMKLGQGGGRGAGPSVCWIHFTSLNSAEILVYQSPEGRVPLLGSCRSEKVKRIECYITIIELESN